MAIEAGDFKTGLTLMVDGDPWVVIDFQHVKPGKGAAILKTKMKNLKTNSTQERNFNANTKFEQAMIEKKSAQFSYSSDDTYYFRVLRCSKCGGRYHARQQIQSGKKYITYHCNGHHNGTCDTPGFSHLKLEASFLKYLDNIKPLEFTDKIID